MQKVMNVLSGNKVDIPPVWMMRQAGRHLPEYLKVRKTTNNFIDFCFDSQKATEVTLQPIDRYDMDAAILFADILLVPIALGRTVSFEKGIGPILDPLSVNDIRNFQINTDTLEPVYETVREVRKKLHNNKTLIGFCGGPWTVATYMLEGKGTPNKEKAKIFAYKNEEAINDLLDYLVHISSEYLIKQAEAGADVLQIFESWASDLSPYLFNKLIIEPTKKIIKHVRDAGITVPIIGFPKNCGLSIKEYVKSSGISAIAVSTEVPLDQIRSFIPRNMAIQGNLDPLALRIGGKTLKNQVQNILDKASGPHIFNLGHGVTPDVKIENIKAVISHIRTGEGNYV